MWAHYLISLPPISVPSVQSPCSLCPNLDRPAYPSARRWASDSMSLIRRSRVARVWVFTPGSAAAANHRRAVLTPSCYSLRQYLRNSSHLANFACNDKAGKSNSRLQAPRVVATFFEPAQIVTKVVVPEPEPIIRRRGLQECSLSTDKVS